jgi:hypothetical protein
MRLSNCSKDWNPQNDVSKSQGNTLTGPRRGRIRRLLMQLASALSICNIERVQYSEGAALFLSLSLSIYIYKRMSFADIWIIRKVYNY